MLSVQKLKSNCDKLEEIEGDFEWRKTKENKGAYRMSVDQRERTGSLLSAKDDDKDELENQRKPLFREEISQSYNVDGNLCGSSMSLSGNKLLRHSKNNKQRTTSYLCQVQGHKKEFTPSWCSNIQLKLTDSSKKTDIDETSDYHYTRIGLNETLECLLGEQQAVDLVCASSRQQYKVDGMAKWQRVVVANEARKRKVAASHDGLKLALSSPILASRSVESADSIAEPLEQLTCSDSLNQKQQSKLEPLEYNNAAASSKQVDQDRLCGVKTVAPLESATMKNLENEACEVVTLRATSPAKASKEERIYYFVDVSHLHPATATPYEPAKLAAAMKPGQPSIEESGCCYNGQANSSYNNSNNKSIASNKTQDSENDNGIEFFSNSCAQKPATLTQVRSQSEGVGESKQQQVTSASLLSLPTKIIPVTATTTSTTTTNSNRNLTGREAKDCSTSDIPSVSNPQKQQQQRKHFHYAPTQQASHDERKLKAHNQAALSAVDYISSNAKTQKLTSQGDGQGTGKGGQLSISSSASSTLVARLMGSYCNSWRQALHPTNSGSYKVTPQHQYQQQQQGRPPTISGTCQASERTEISAIDVEQQQVASVISSGSRRIISTRLPRPRRSPISLQRQTNARLYKHRLRIQQQRQEQLTQLAIRERQQIYHSKSGQQGRSPLAVATTHSHDHDQIMQNARWQPAAPANQALYVIADSYTNSNTNRSKTNKADQRYQQELTSSLGQVKLASNKCFRGQKQEITSCTQDFTNLNGQPNQSLLYQVIVPSSTQLSSRAIEICDNQLACTSRLTEQLDNTYNPTSSSSCQRTSTNQPAATKTLHKSINMIQSSISGTHIQYVQGQLNDSGRKAATRFENQNIDRDDDTHTISSNSSTLSLNRPFCKICHLGSMKNGDKLISPCKCSGTMQYIHCGCLLKWLEISNRTNEKLMSCELCAHEYSWHKKFNYKHIKWPRCSTKDIFLHIIFVIAVGIMIFSAIAPMVEKRVVDTTKQPANYGVTSPSSSSSLSDDIQSRPVQNPHIYHATFGGRSNHLTATGHLAHEEKFMLICAASFFLSFFLAIYTQTKARDTLYGLIRKFLNLNRTYYITEYDHGSNHVNNIANKNLQLTSNHSRAYRKSGSEEVTNH